MILSSSPKQETSEQAA